MKKIKVSFFALLALLVGTVASSFTIHANKPLAESWFIYNGGTMTTPGNYTEVSSEPSCEGADVLCAIYVTEGANNKPDQSALTNLYNNNDQFAEPVPGLIEFKP